MTDMRSGNGSQNGEHLKKEIYKRIDNVLQVLGAKREEMISARDEAEGLIHVFLNPGELPPIVETVSDGGNRLEKCIDLENEIVAWDKKIREEMTQIDTDLKKLLEKVHQDMLNFIKRIENI